MKKLKDPKTQICELLNTMILKIDGIKYPDHIFLFSDNKVMFMYQPKKGNLWVRYSEIWKIFENEYSMKHEQIEHLIKQQVAESLNWMNAFPCTGGGFLLNCVEDHFNSEDFAPPFEDVVRPAIKWINENSHPHTTIVITPTGAELLEGVKTTGFIPDFLKD